MSATYTDHEGFEVIPVAVEGAAFLLASGAGAAVLNGWISKTSWSGGEYNTWMRLMNDTIKQWDALGWKLGCWAKYPDARKRWLDFWSRFAKHYKEHPTVSPDALISWATESEEGGARILMTELATWGTWLNTTCGAKLDVKELTESEKKAAAADATQTDWGAVAKWAGIGILGLVGLNVVTGLRGAFTKR